MVAARAPNYFINATTQPIYPEDFGKKTSQRRTYRRPTVPQARVRVKFNKKEFVVVVEKGENKVITQMNAYKQIASEAYLEQDSALLCAVVNKMMEFADANKQDGYWELITAYLMELQKLSKKAA